MVIGLWLLRTMAKNLKLNMSPKNISNTKSEQIKTEPPCIYMVAIVFFSTYFCLCGLWIFFKIPLPSFKCGFGREHSICQIYLQFLNWYGLLFCFCFVLFLRGWFPYHFFYFCKILNTFRKVHKTYFGRLMSNYKANSHASTIQIKNTPCQNPRSPFPCVPPTPWPHPLSQSIPLLWLLL